MTLFTKDECGLCRRAEAALRRLNRRIPFELEFVDIERDAEAFHRYWDRVPVVLVEGREVAAGRVDQRELRLILSPRG